MKKALSLLSLAVLTIGLLGSCSKINERIDGVEKRVESIENEKIASIENQIAAINSSIADLGQIRSDISSLKQSAVNHGQDISELQEADETLKNRIDNLEDYLDVDLKKYAEKDWAIATFATLEQLDSTKMDLSALEGKVNKLGETFDGKLSDLKTNLTNSITSAINGVNASISALEARVSALEAMIQSVSITPAYSDGSVEAVDSILTLKCIVSPAEALIGMKSLKDSLLIYADSVKVKTKATTPAYMTIEVSEASVLDAAQGAITLAADISEYLPKGEDKALTVAVNIRNGISDFTTEFVPVYVTNWTFKAVYNTNGGANTLTFYYDDVDHSGEGITVYDNLPSASTMATDWGYNDKRGEIKSVVIDASVAGYKGLTSTACMFYNMTAASYISGAEYLNVSKVTNMMAMFWNFGSKSGTLSSVPDVKDWNTGSVTNMQNMFTSYGAGSKDFNAVPDVGKWNTASVTNMTNMFLSFGSYSSTLSSVPDVKEWNTASVTNMNSMFESYGAFSKNLNKVPDVSKWNTDRVTDMGDMFLNYGYNSTALNTVLDVSGWNTIEVTSMTNMFQNYGYSSTGLSTVPNVSNWKTGKVTRMTNMFNGYGNTSTNISCVLDLSGWDLSKITSGDDVFKFNPSTFNVTIPAKTGEKSNEGGKWYYGNGTDHIAPPTGKTFTILPAGALKGVFSVSATKKVYFSQGNLWADGSNALHFEANQYSSASSWDASHVSHFTWSSTVEAAVGNNNSGDNLFCDESHKVSVDGGEAIYYALSRVEWTYLFDNHSKKWATVNGVGGYVIAPDNVTLQAEKTSYTATELNDANLVFLPAAGFHIGSYVNNVGEFSYYWSSTANDGSSAYYVSFSSYDVSPDDIENRYYGFSVRLITEVLCASGENTIGFGDFNDGGSF